MEWDTYPDIYFMRSSASDRTRLRKFINQLMEDSYLDDSDFAFRIVSGVDQIKLQWVLDTLIHELGDDCMQAARACNGRPLSEYSVALHLLPSAAGVCIFRKNMYRLMCWWQIFINWLSCVVSLETSETWFILAPEALAEGGSMERVISIPTDWAIRMMRQPAGLVAWFGWSRFHSS